MKHFALIFLIVNLPQLIGQQFSNYTVLPSCIGENNGSIILGFDQSHIDEIGLNISWYSEGVLIAENVPMIDHLAPGDYVYNPSSIDGCEGYHVITVPTITEDFSSIGLSSPLIVQSSCSESNGSIELLANAPDLYTFTWHQGDENGQVLPASPDNPALLENLVPGTYTVVVTQTATGCTAVESYEVGETSTIISPSSIVCDHVESPTVDGFEEFYIEITFNNIECFTPPFTLTASMPPGGGQFLCS